MMTTETKFCVAKKQWSVNSVPNIYEK